jgi:hypothetical protein
MGLSNEEIAQMMADDYAEGCRQWTIKEYGPAGYRMVEWPFSQDYMDEEWFDDEAYLDVTDQYDDCAYWIPEERIMERNDGV